MSDILLEGRRGSVLELTLNRPDKRNALSSELVGAMVEALERATTEPAVHVVVLRGAGPDFCSGADLAELERIGDMGPEASLEDAGRLGSLFVQMRRLPKPIVAAVHGRALAGGCGVATACDMIIASDSAEFGYPEVRLGFVPAMVMALLVRKVGESRAFEMASMGLRYSAADAERMGLVNRIVPDDELEETVRAFTDELASRPASAVALTKRLLYGLGQVGIEEGIARGAEVNALARASEACRTGVRAFLERTRARGDRTGAGNDPPRVPEGDSS
jgi:methylglutaconyl-CoA hydratase